MTQYDIPQPPPLRDRGDDGPYDDEGPVRGTGRPLMLLEDLLLPRDPEGPEVDRSQQPISWIDL